MWAWPSRWLSSGLSVFTGDLSLVVHGEFAPRINCGWRVLVNSSRRSRDELSRGLLPKGLEGIGRRSTHRYDEFGRIRERPLQTPGDLTTLANFRSSPAVV